jgi:hypothetical protein
VSQGPNVEPVGIAPDRGDRGQRVELGQELRGADVSGMEDPVDSAEYLEDLRPEEAMGIRDYAEAQSAPSGS